MVSDSLFIMDFNGERVGKIIRTSDEFVQELYGEVTKYKTLPPILNDIAPASTQFPEANDVLDYYRMDKMDVWTYLHRSNGIKGSRNYWFLSEPIGEVWLPFFVDEYKYRSFGSLLREGAEVRVLMTSQAYILRRSLDIFPKVIQEYLVRDRDTRFSTVTGEVYDLVQYPGQRGLAGRVVLNFPKKTDGI